jgi:hypothetical protein
MYKRVLAIGLSTVLAGGAIVFAAGAPALAVANPVVVSAASGVGSPPFQSAVATCPAGFTLTGSGGRVLGAAGLVTMTDVIPNVAAGTVTVWANEAGNGTNQMWAVEAVAICDPVVVGVVQISMTSAFDAASPKTVAAVCPAATNLTGLGFKLNNGNGDVFPDDLVPSAALTLATVTGYDNGAAGNWSITGIALCAPLPMGAAPLLVNANTPFNMNAAKSITSPNCPPGTRTTGVGGQLTGAVGNAILTQMAPNAIATRSVAGADAYAGFNGNWRLDTYNICW